MAPVYEGKVVWKTCCFSPPVLLCTVSIVVQLNCGSYVGEKMRCKLSHFAKIMQPTLILDFLNLTRADCQIPGSCLP